MPLTSSQTGRSGNHGNYGRVDVSGLILEYAFQNPTTYGGSGTTVTDLRGNSNATLWNAPAWTATGTRYLDFNGTNQYLITNTSLNSKLNPTNTGTNVSIFVWVYLKGNGVIVTELGQTTINTAWHDAQIELVGGKLVMAVWPYNAKVTSSGTYALNQWYYVGFTYNGATQSLIGYVDGVSIGSATGARTSPYNSNSANMLIYAVAAADTTNLGNGGYGNIRLGAFHIYNRPLTGLQVQQNFNYTRTIYGR